MRERMEVAIDALRCVCDPKQFKFRNTSHLVPLEGVIGQERAVQAIDFGLNMKSSGYNIFVTGQEGTGKATIVQDLVTRYAQHMPTPPDWCMVNNFKDTFCPEAISMAPGEAGEFKKLMAKFIEELKKALPKAFSSKSHVDQVAGVQEKYNERQRKLFQHLDQVAAAKNLGINRTQAGFETFPIIDGKPMTEEQYQALSTTQREVFERDVRRFQADIDAALRESGKLNLETQSELDKITRQVALFVVKNRIEVLKTRYRDSRDIQTFLNAAMNDIVDNVEDFLPGTEEEEASAIPPAQFGEVIIDPYQVNILVDRKGLQGAPVIFETNPSYQNIFGNIEKRAYMGSLLSDYTMVQAGSLLRANGGYLILEIESVLMQPGVWQALKRALQTKQLCIEDTGMGMGYGGTVSLRPEPIPLDVKVILIGSYELFEGLQNYDSKFNKIFKVRADFDYEVECNSATIEQYVRFVAGVCKREELLPLTPNAVSAVVEFGERQVANKQKLSLRFGSVHSLLKEADYWARKLNAKTVMDKHILKAMDEHRFRHNLYEEKLHESYADNSILIDVRGRVVGQVNALAVYQIGEFSFGRPSRITAETFMGKEGVINIERKSGLSGKTYDKGVLILSGFLGRTFAGTFPLSLTISVTFEQSYEGVDGDSASSTELYAILSSLSAISIDQGIAVTGSVNQKGEVQAIGGVNQKVEGFYEVCKTKGLTGLQGVMIPKVNVKNLMLNREILKAVQKKKFHIYQVSTVAEGIELLTGVPAGVPNANGDFPEKTVFGKVQKRLRTFVENQIKLRCFQGGEVHT
jgi:lon-related putative ATP-dependent protease